MVRVQPTEAESAETGGMGMDCSVPAPARHGGR